MTVLKEIILGLVVLISAGEGASRSDAHKYNKSQIKRLQRHESKRTQIPEPPRIVRFDPRLKLTKGQAIFLIGTATVFGMLTMVDTPSASPLSCPSEVPCTRQLTRLEAYYYPSATFSCRDKICEIGMSLRDMFSPTERTISAVAPILESKINPRDFAFTLDELEGIILPEKLVDADSHRLSLYVRKTLWDVAGQNSERLLLKSKKSGIDFTQVNNCVRYFKGRELELYKGLALTVKDTEIEMGRQGLWHEIIRDVLVRKVKNYHHFVSRYYRVNALLEEGLEKVQQGIDIAQMLLPTEPILAAAHLHQVIRFADNSSNEVFRQFNAHVAIIWMNLFLKEAGYPGIFVQYFEPYEMAAQEALIKKDPSIFASYIKQQLCVLY